ncbi:hypothetical protein CDS [Bradyrhizobium sp.]|nr:hypothetical protein CDS [Bradyrhizobium sp.]
MLGGGKEGARLVKHPRPRARGPHVDADIRSRHCRSRSLSSVLTQAYQQV